jgi:hypothetical protein
MKNKLGFDKDNSGCIDYHEFLVAFTIAHDGDVQKVNPFEVNLFMCKGYFYVFLIFKIET